MRVGLPVPGAFCIRGEAYREHLRTHGLLGRIESTIAGFEPAGSTTAGDGTKRAALAEIRDAIVNAPLETALAGEIEEQLDLLGGCPIAVRSSATAEDLPGYSFAGQHGTYFASEPSNCLRLVKSCWASLWTERAFAYRRANGFNHLDVDMAVIVQRLVAADASGVLFTADPVCRRTDRIVIEACLGLGEALVSGKVNPDRYVLTKSGLDVIEHSVTAKSVEVLPGESGEVIERKTSAKRASEPAIDLATARQLAESALRAERNLEAPQDMEWAVAGGEPFFLQSRPITTLGPEEPDPLSQSAFSIENASRRTVWTNANVGEVLPDVVPPMTWSILVRFLDALLGAIFGSIGLELTGKQTVSLICGRAYFDALLLAGAFRRLPVLGRIEIDTVLGGMEAPAHEPISVDDMELPDIQFSRLKALRRFPRFLIWFFRHSPRSSGAYIAEMARGTQDLLAMDRSALSDAELAARILRTADTMDTLADAIAFAGVGFMYYTNLCVVCRRWLGDADGRLPNRLLAGLGGMASAEAGLDLWRLAVLAKKKPAVERVIVGTQSFETARSEMRSLGAGGRAFLAGWDAFMEQHGHHARGEIDVMNARWSESPDYVLDLVRSYIETSGETDPEATCAERAADRRRLADDCRARLRNPLKRRLFTYVLHQTQKGSVVRENVKSEGVRRLAALRWMLLGLGEKLAARGALGCRDDIFFISLEEIEPLLDDGPAVDMKKTIAGRRREYEENLAVTPPPVIVGRFDPDDFISDAVDCDTCDLTGLAVSAGVASGPARVILRADASERVLPGEILVAPFTDPGWTPYFLPAAGIVMDMGGMLSHGSIVAREYGIPAVVNVGPATKIVKTGQMIEVDGTRGTVRILG